MAASTMPDSSGRLLPALLAALIIGGCFAAAPPEDKDDEPGRPPAPQGFSYVCPAAASTFQAGPACAAELVDPARTFQEPYVANHRHDPDTIAIVAIVGDALGQPGLRYVDGFLTHDAGATWTPLNVPVPYFVTPQTMAKTRTVTNDPVLAFDDEGTLHLAMLTASDEITEAEDVLYMTRRAGSNQWDETKWLTNDGRAGRVALAMAPDGTRYVAWEIQDPDMLRGSLAWLGPTDNDWQTLPTGKRLENCAYPTPAIVGKHVVVVCSRRDDGTGHVHAFDAKTASFVKLADVGQGAFFGAPAATGNDSFAVATQLRHDAIVLNLFQGNGSRVPMHTNQTAIVETQAPVDWIELMAFGADAWGQVHLLVRQSDRSSADPTGRNPMWVRHEVFAARDGSPAGSAELQEMPWPAVARPVPAPDWDDGFYAADFQGERGVLVWTGDRTIRYAFLGPA